MRSTTLLFALLLSAWILPPQQDLPTYGSLADLNDLSKVYVAAEDEQSRERIIKALKKYPALEVVNAPDAAEFFLEYGNLDRDASVSTSEHIKERKVKSQMRAYKMTPEKKRIIAWAKTNERETEHFFGMKMYDSGKSEGQLTSDFIKALKKARGEKK